MLPSGTAANPTITPTVTGITTYTISVTDDLGCTQSATIDLEVTPTPILTILSSKNPICAGETATLSATSDKTVSTWNWGAALPAPGPAIGDNIVTPAVTTIYNLTVVDTDGCSSTLKDTLVIAVTAESSVEQMKKAREANFNGFIGKPLDPDRFPDQIRRILAGESVWEMG